MGSDGNDIRVNRRDGKVVISWQHPSSPLANLAMFLLVSAMGGVVFYMNQDSLPILVGAIVVAVFVAYYALASSLSRSYLTFERERVTFARRPLMDRLPRKFARAAVGGFEVDFHVSRGKEPRLVWELFVLHWGRRTALDAWGEKEKGRVEAVKAAIEDARAMA